MNNRLVSEVGTVVSERQDTAKPRPGVYEGPALLVLAPDSPESLGWLLVIKEVIVVSSNIFQTSWCHSWWPIYSKRQIVSPVATGLLTMLLHAITTDSI